MSIIIISFLTGLMTSLGAFICILSGRPSRQDLALYLGLSGGMMLLVVFVDLLPAGLSQGNHLELLLGIFTGILLFLFLDFILQVKNKKKNPSSLGILMFVAIALHNLPEGLAIGAGYAAANEIGILLALSIAFHNIPEGIGVAAPFLWGGVSRKKVILLTFIVGLCIPLGTWIGSLFFLKSMEAITFSLGLACGTMGFVAVKEVIPASLQQSRFFTFVGMLLAVTILYMVHLLHPN